MHRGDVFAERFVIESLAGSGGMGQVYRASDRQTGQSVAIKVLHSIGSTDIARFDREARILREIDDARVVKFIAHGTAPSGDPYLVMEWLDGEDLARRLARGRLTPAESVALCHTVADMLGNLHEKGIVHRDLKPSNVFLVDGRTDHVKILDFGIAQIEASTRMTGTGTLIGTFGYMAPEQANGTHDIDARADVFALGCVLFECIAGEPAFSGTHPMAILTKILFEDAPRLEDRCAEVPVELGSLVCRLLAKNPDDRPRNGRAVATALRALGDMSQRATVKTVVASRSPALTDSEQRALAVIFVSAPENDSQVNDESIETVAHAHGATMQRLWDGSLAFVLLDTGVATDLATRAARCALAFGRETAGRRVVLAMGRGHTAGTLPMGRAIDQAAKLLGSESFSSGVIAIDDAAVGLLDARFDVRETPAGFVLHGERELAEGTRTLLGKATPCVGRDWELGTLERLFDECIAEGVSRAVLLTGPAGAGKSRLGQEFLRHIKESGSNVALWYGRGDPLRAGSAFGLLAQCLRRACGIQDGEPLDMRRQKLLARVAEQVSEREQRRVAEFLGEIIGTPLPDDDSLPLRAARKDAQLMNDQMRAAFLDFLAAECAARPVVLGFEDLHWGDLPTVQFVDRALRDLNAAPLFVIALARPEVHDLFPKLWGERQVQEIRIKQLHRKAIERLARHVMGERADRAMIERIAQLSEGNAFYLEELIRWAAEGGSAELPETLVAMVQSRLGAINDEARRILRAASIFGEAFWTGGVATLLGGAEHASTVRERFRELVDQEVFIKRGESRFPGEEEVAFRHALLREGAYAMLTEEDRALGHGLAGGWLEEHGEQDALVLAEHFEKGRDSDRAARHYLRAAEQANKGGDSTASIAYAQRGLACGAREDLRIGLLGVLCEASVYHAELAVMSLPYADELLLKSVPGSAPWAQGMVVQLYAAVHSGRMQDFVATLRNLREVEPSPDATAPLTLSLIVGVYILDLLTEIQEAEVVLDRLTKITSTLDHRESIAQFMSCLIHGMRVCVNEDPARGLDCCQAAWTIAHAAGHHRYLSGAERFIALNQWFLGLHPQAERALKEQTFPDEECGYASSIRSFVLAWLLADRGNVLDARVWATRLVASGKARNLPLDEGRGHWVLAEVLRRAGDFDAADVEIQAALTLLGMVCPLDHPGALATLSALRLSEGRLTEALTAAEEGLSKYESKGACGMFRGAFLRLTHAECLEATGDHAAARVAIGKARQWLLGVAAKIDDDEYKKSFLENVPENRRILELAQQWSIASG